MLHLPRRDHLLTLNAQRRERIKDKRRDKIQEILGIGLAIFLAILFFGWTAYVGVTADSYDDYASYTSYDPRKN